MIAKPALKRPNEQASNELFAAVEQQLNQSVPWELFICKLGELPSTAWPAQIHAELDSDSLSAIAQSALGKGRLCRANRRNLQALQEWITSADLGVTIDRVRSAAKVISAFGDQEIKIRNVYVQALSYLAPSSKQIVQLLYRCDRALSNTNAIVFDLMAGSSVCVIHPFLDGNGRVSRLYFLRALLRLGVTISQALALLETFNGADARAAMMQRQAATYAGDPLPFFNRWKEVLSDAKVIV